MMQRCLLFVGAALGLLDVVAQTPVTRSVRILAGDRDGGIHLLADDAEGMLWVTSEQGLLRSDGRRSRILLPLDSVHITALTADSLAYVALSNGVLLRCHATGCDTLLVDPALRRTPVTTLLHTADGVLWCGTYGAGVRTVGRPGGEVHLNEPLGDGHVNALVAISEGRVALGTDQGVAICNAQGKVLVRITEEDGLPDNLVLALDRDDEGDLWVGTHHSGVCRVRWSAGAAPQVVSLATEGPLGPVKALVRAEDQVWVGTPDGLLVLHADAALAGQVQLVVEQGTRVQDVLRAKDGAVWWSTGGPSIGRGLPDASVFRALGGRPLGQVNALAELPGRALAVATPDAVALVSPDDGRHANARTLPFRIDVQRPVVALHATPDGSLWAGTFGGGVQVLRSDGRLDRYDAAKGLCNENVLALDGGPSPNGGTRVWAATLGGVCVYEPTTDRFRAVPMPGPGFVYDILCMPDGAVYAATDGSGIVRIAPDGSTQVLGRGTHATFYSVCRDHQGGVWATGPEMDLCRLEGDSLVAVFVPHDPGDVFGLAAYGDGVVLLAQGGLWYTDRQGRALDLAPFLGAGDLEAELNTLRTAADGALWAACDQGLFRLRPDIDALSAGPRALLVERRSGDLVLPRNGKVRLPHDHDFITFKFAAPYFGVAAGELRFEYRLIGQDATVHTTADEEVAWSRLAPGDYRFELRATAAGRQGPWTSYAFAVAKPWWRTWQALGAAVVLLTVLFFLYIRARERRLNAQERARRAKAQAELAALRSQVNPHFLFNSFNTLLALIEEDKGRAAEHVEQLSDFFREILQLSNKDLVSLRDDLHMARTYFALEQRRFGDLVRLEVDVPEGALGRSLPPLTLQLLVENAIKHNIATEERPLTITIHATEERVEVASTFQPRPSTHTSTGFGLSSIRQRFAELSTVPVEQVVEDGRFVVRLPLMHT